ncbi:MAG: sterol desaturase family protein [Acidobacteriota bacterium]
MIPSTLALHVLVGFPLGLVYANATEWVMHKYVLHGLGRRKKTFWSFHWDEHHGAARRNGMIDEDYLHLLSGWNGQTKEIAALLGAALIHVPLFAVAPGFALGAVYGAVNYYRVHRKAHLDPAWAREHLPWHVDHHMGPNQDANWCVTRPWFDWVMGTREKYVGTECEARRNARLAARLAAA